MATERKVVEKKDFICHYRQQWHGKRSKGSSEHQHGKRKRWYEQFYKPEDPRATGLSSVSTKARRLDPDWRSHEVPAFDFVVGGRLHELKPVYATAFYIRRCDYSDDGFSTGSRSATRHYSRRTRTFS
jgi:hypothetical protein